MKNSKPEKMKEATAIRYSPEIGKAPVIVAMGKGETAVKIIETAKKNDVPLYQDSTLAHVLGAMNPGDEIPPELYEVVAQILVFVSKVDESFKDRII